MEAIIYRVPYQSRKDIFKLYPLGDIHAGTEYCVEPKIIRQVKTISNDPLARWVGMGDYADLVLPTDFKRWDNTISDWVHYDNVAHDQCVWVYELFKPIRDKCIGLIGGNHEDSVRRHYSYDFMTNLCENLKVPNLGYSAFVRLVFDRQGGTKTEFLCHFTHGSGAPQTEGGKVMNLKRSFDDFEGDILAKGHIHGLHCMEKPFLTVTRTDPPRIVDRNRCGALTGSWFLTYMQGVKASYGERRTYDPTAIGCPVFCIDPTNEMVSVYSNSNMMIDRLSQ